MEFSERYYAKLLAAFVRGRLCDANPEHPLFLKGLNDISPDEAEQLWEIGKGAELSLHKFKQKDVLPRVRKVLGLLRGLTVHTMLDVGTGRGTFVWPLLVEFPWVEVSCLDILPHRVRDLQAVAKGGIHRLSARKGSIVASGMEDEAVDVVTLLEVVEHIPECEKAIAEAVRIARMAVLLSVPAKEDDNPEHIHLFTPDRLRNMFAAAGLSRVKFHFVPNHIIALALK